MKMKKLFKALNELIDFVVFKLILVLTYFTIPVFLCYTFYNVYHFNLIKILVGALLVVLLIDSNKKIGGKG